MRGLSIIQRIFKKRLSRATIETLSDLTNTARDQAQEQSRELSQLCAGKESSIGFGKTGSGQQVAVPFSDAIRHGLVLGASGSGKSFFGLSLIAQLLQNNASPIAPSFGLLDPKGELFAKTVRLIYAYLYRCTPQERERLIKRIVIIDFGQESGKFITPYNILVHQAELPDEIMVGNRIDTIAEQFSGLSEMSVRMKLIAKYLFLLLAEFDLPISYIERLCNDQVLMKALVEKSTNPQIRDYFLYRFEDESRSTMLALRQRIDSLLMSEGVRLSLSATSVPDFAALQDQGAIILINTAGRMITRGIAELLQGLVLSDIKQSIFRRSNSGQRFLWFFDEAQNLYKTSANKEHMVDLFTMARSFNSHLVLLTQSLTSAVRDADILNSITGNASWVVLLRSTLRDAELLSPAIPISGTMPKPKPNPFEPIHYFTDREELKLQLNEITKLPNRSAYCWLKAHLSKAVKITTPLVLPDHEIAGCPSEAFEQFMKAERLGQGVTKAEIGKALSQHEQRLSQLFKTPDSSIDLPFAKENQGTKTSKRSVLHRLEEEYSRKTQRK
jgi:hypothetical protein